jgi:hypothetical protein
MWAENSVFPFQLIVMCTEEQTKIIFPSVQTAKQMVHSQRLQLIWLKLNES